MRTRTFIIVLMTLVLIGAVLTGTINAMEHGRAAVKPALENVRSYAAPAALGGRAYAIDGGALYAGETNNWAKVNTPAGIIVNAVAVDSSDPKVVYIGGGNDLAVYRSQDAGKSWMRVPLSEEYIGAVTDIAVDSAQKLVYAGTDTAGLFRLRDVGSSMIIGGQLLLDEPVVKVAADSTGAGMAFVLTPTTVYRSEQYGLAWHPVENLGSAPTALAVANGENATVYVGTADRGVLSSADGLTWTLANEGLGMNPGARLYVDALAVDPMDGEVVYAATSYLFGSTTAHQTPVGVSMSSDGAHQWTQIAEAADSPVAELLPVSGQPGAVYALTTTSRTPLALGDAPQAVAAAMPDAAGAAGGNGWLAWVIAGAAALALAFAALSDLGRRRPDVAQPATPEYARERSR